MGAAGINLDQGVGSEFESIEPEPLHFGREPLRYFALPRYSFSVRFSATPGPSHIPAPPKQEHWAFGIVQNVMFCRISIQHGGSRPIQMGFERPALDS